MDCSSIDFREALQLYNDEQGHYHHVPNDNVAIWKSSPFIQESIPTFVKGHALLEFEGNPCYKFSISPPQENNYAFMSTRDTWHSLSLTRGIPCRFNIDRDRKEGNLDLCIHIWSNTLRSLILRAVGIWQLNKYLLGGTANGASQSCVRFLREKDSLCSSRSGN